MKIDVENLKIHSLTNIKFHHTPKTFFRTFKKCNVNLLAKGENTKNQLNIYNKHGI